MTGRPIHRSWVRALAAAEVVVGVVVIAAGGFVPLAAMAALYAAFAAFVAIALRRDTPLRSCGCLGVEDIPPTAIHLVVDVAAAVVFAVAAFSGAPSLADAMAEERLLGLPLVGLGALGTYLLYVMLTDLALTLRAGRPA